MNIIFEGNKTIVEGSGLSLKHTLDCGQAFRWLPYEDGYLGVAYGKALFIRESRDTVEMYPCTQDDFESVWRGYFDLDTDYGKIRQALAFDKYVGMGMDYADGMHILSQEPFETMISFILSANNNVKRIQGIIERICQRFGKKIEDGGFARNAFPTPEVLAGANVDELEECGAGYRASYIIHSAEMVRDGFDLQSMRCMDYDQARKKLLALPGVGPKVAECILLFSLSHGCAFPIDVWVGRIMRTLYLDEDAKNDEIECFAHDRFGNNAGLAQQCLFHYARNNGISKDGMRHVEGEK